MQVRSINFFLPEPLPALMQIKWIAQQANKRQYVSNAKHISSLKCIFSAVFFSSLVLLRFNEISVWISGMWQFSVCPANILPIEHLPTFFLQRLRRFIRHVVVTHTHTQARLSLLMTPKRCASSPIETKMQDNGSEIPVFQCNEKKNELHRPFESTTMCRHFGYRSKQWTTV